MEPVAVTPVPAEQIQRSRLTSSPNLVERTQELLHHFAPPAHGTGAATRSRGRLRHKHRAYAELVLTYVGMAERSLRALDIRTGGGILIAVRHQKLFETRVPSRDQERNATLGIARVHSRLRRLEIAPDGVANGVRSVGGEQGG